MGFSRSRVKNPVSEVHHLFIIIIIITNEEIIVAFSPKTTRTRYKLKNKTARYVVSSSIEKQLVTDTTAQTIVSSAIPFLVPREYYGKLEFPSLCGSVDSERELNIVCANTARSFYDPQRMCGRTERLDSSYWWPRPPVRNSAKKRGASILAHNARRCLYGSLLAMQLRRLGHGVLYNSII